MPKETKRRLLYNKRIAPNTFVFFFHKGPRDTSWSVRDYSVRGAVALRYASDFRNEAGEIPMAAEIRMAAEYDLPTPVHPTTDLDHWHAAITAKKAEYLDTRNATPPAAAAPIPPTQQAYGALVPCFRS